MSRFYIPRPVWKLRMKLTAEALERMPDSFCSKMEPREEVELKLDEKFLKLGFRRTVQLDTERVWESMPNGQESSEKHLQQLEN
jgi:hypothetical protein